MSELLTRKQLEVANKCNEIEAKGGNPNCLKCSCFDYEDGCVAENLFPQTTLALLNMLEKTTEALDKVTDWTDCETLGVISPHPIPILKEAKNLLKKMEGWTNGVK